MRTYHADGHPEMMALGPLNEACHYHRSLGTQELATTTIHQQGFVNSIRILITGGAEFIGGHIVDTTLARSHG
jgi:hypothetical protein